jgi:hypothetical protein
MNDFHEQLRRAKNQIKRSEVGQECDELLDLFHSPGTSQAFKKAMSLLEESGTDAENELMEDMRKVSGNGRISIRTRQRFNQREYVTEIDKNSFILNIMNLKKKMKLEVLQTVFLAAGTKKGLVYFLAVPAEGKLLLRAFMSHLFDRFSARLHNGALSRKDAIVKFMRSFSTAEHPHGPCALAFNKDTAEVLDFVPSGVLLGMSSVLTEEDGLLMAFKTFITYEMLNDHQKNLYQKIKLGSPTHPWHSFQYEAIGELKEI